MSRPAWMDDAECRHHPEVDFHPSSKAAAQQAIAICRTCPSQSLCLAYALDAQEGEGVWGGTTELDREKMLRSRGR